MFEKLLSQALFNSSAFQQLAFYSRRMHEEASIRRIGMFFLVLSFMVQFFAVLNPPVLAANCNDNSMLDCGFSSISEAKRDCLDNKQGFMKFLHYYGISCGAFDSASEK